MCEHLSICYKQRNNWQNTEKIDIFLFGQLGWYLKAFLYLLQPMKQLIKYRYHTRANITRTQIKPALILYPHLKGKMKKILLAACNWVSRVTEGRRVQ